MCDKGTSYNYVVVDKCGGHALPVHGTQEIPSVLVFEYNL